jgi:hypothetical protein
MPQNQQMRNLVARMKLIPIRKLIDGKRLLFCAVAPDHPEIPAARGSRGRHRAAQGKALHALLGRFELLLNSGLRSATLFYRQ